MWTFQSITLANGPAGSVPVDGLEAGRALAADRISLSLRFHFLERDTFDCVGCSS